MNRRAEWLAVASLTGAIAWFLVALFHVSQLPGGIRSHDTYSSFYPTMIVAARAVQEGGKGLFWTPLHGCGLPFFADGMTGLLYPPGLLSLVLPLHQALYGLLFFNLTVAAVSAYFLCRELGVGVPAAWCGGLAFALSNASTDLITGTPPVSGPYAWLPAGMLFCERILRRPSLRNGIGLGTVIALALLPGHPQLAFYLYQLVGLRLLWELLTRPGLVRGRTIAMLALGLALGPLLVAIQLLPNLEVMRIGVRNAARGLADISFGGYLTWTGLRNKTIWRFDPDNPFQLMPWVIAAAAFLHPEKRRLIAFYALLGGLALVLALGPNGFLFPLYMKLPFGTLFSDPSRFLWITSFCIAVLVAFGADAMVRVMGAGSPWRPRLVVAATIVAAMAGYRALSPVGLRATDDWGLACAVVAAAIVVLTPRLRIAAALAIIAALVFDLLLMRQMPMRHLLEDDALLFARAPFFASLRERMTPHDRVYLAPPQEDFSLQQKSGSLMKVPVLYDYEAQPSRRWAAYFVMLRTGAMIRGHADWGLIVGGWFPSGFKRPLLDLAAARYVVVADGKDQVSSVPGVPFRLVSDADDVRLYENPTALARARFVPRVEVVADPEALLARLAAGTDDPGQLALVEEPPASGFLGEARQGTDATGAVTFETDDPEHLVLRVHAPRRGFLFLADQHYAGWHATVDGAAVPIARANYVFRLVEVPAGDSVVELRYRPMSVALGALVSGVTLLGVVGLLVASRR